MIVGIGIDVVNISEIARYLDETNNAFLNHTFTRKEVENSKNTTNQAEYLATRFAAKEAVFKAVAHLTKNKSFDLRIVETLNDKDGYPFINACEELKLLLTQAIIKNLHVSITTEDNYATAMVVAER